MNRRAEIIKAAMPHFEPSSAELLKVLLHVEELRELMSGSLSRAQLSAQAMETQPVDVEAMLTDIRQLCTPKEQQLIDSVLSFFQLRRVMEMAQIFRDAPPGEGSDESGFDMMDFVMSMMNTDT